MDTYEQKKHHAKKGFVNSYPIEDHGFGSLLKWQWQSAGKKGKKMSFPVVEPNLEIIKNPGDKAQITWINHATYLLQYDSVTVLTDPIFSERCSPVQWAGPKRFTEPGLDFEALPEIDFVIISHNHYDHLDVGTIKRLQEKQHDNPPLWIVPLKIKQWFLDLGVTNVIELDWWDSTTYEGVEIHCVPAQHFSGRGLTDRNETLWAGWVLIKNDFRFYFAGDTGYSPEFKEIGERLGPFTVSCIPIGAYKPRWFMQGVHVDPYQAVDIHRDVQSKHSIGMHWGTFALADEDMDEPPRALKDALEKASLPDSVFTIMKHGETRFF